MENNWRSSHPKVCVSINCLKSKESCLFRQGRTVCKAYCVQILVRLCEAVHSRLSELKTAQYKVPTSWHSFSSLSSLCQAVYEKDINCLTGTCPLFTRYGTQWFLALSEIKTSMKGRRFQDTEDVQKNVTVPTVILKEEFMNVSNRDNIARLSVQLLRWNTRFIDPLAP